MARSVAVLRKNTVELLETRKTMQADILAELSKKSRSLQRLSGTSSQQCRRSFARRSPTLTATRNDSSRLVAMPMNILSGSNTPLDSQPAWVRTIMQASPSTHFVSFAQAILYRGAEFQDVWPRFLAVLAIAVMRFRRVAEQAI